MSVAEFFRKFSFLRKDEVMQNESWDVRMDGDMVIAGLSERTREAYLRAARQLAKFHRRADPGTLAERERCKGGRCYWRFWLVRSRGWRRLVRRERRAADLVFASLVRIWSWDSGCSASQ